MSHAQLPPPAGPRYASDAGASARISTERFDLFDVGQVMGAVRRRWLSFAGAFILAAGGVGYYYTMQRPVFVSSGLIFMSGSGQSGRGSGAIVGGESLVQGPNITAESHKGMLHSNELAVRVVSHAGLNGTLSGDAAFLPTAVPYWSWWKLTDAASFQNGLQAVRTTLGEKTVRPQEFEIKFEGPGTFSVTRGGAVLASGELDKDVKLEDASFALHYEGARALEKGRRFTLRIEPAEAKVAEFLSHLTTENVSASGSLLRVTYTSESPFACQATVEAVVEEYVRMDHVWDASITQDTMTFVDRQIGDMRASMDHVVTQMTQAQAKAGVMDVDSDRRKRLQEMQDVQADFHRQQDKATEVERLSALLDQEALDGYAFAGVDDASVKALAARLVELNGAIAAMGAKYQTGYPALNNLVNQRKAVTADLRRAVDEYRDKLGTRMEDLSGRVKELKEQFAAVPAQTMDISEYGRAAKVYEDLYMFLLQERERTRLARETTRPRFKVMDRPTPPAARVPASAGVIAFNMFGVGLAAAMLAVLLPAMKGNLYQSADHVQKSLGRPVLAVLPFHGRRAHRATPQVIDRRDRGPFVEALNHLRLKLMNAMPTGPRTILVTSSQSLDGKSLIVSNLVCNLAKSPRVKNVLVIDADMYNPSLHEVFEGQQMPGLSDYLAGKANAREIVQTIDTLEGQRIHLISAGKIAASPMELLETAALGELLEFAGKEFDFVVIDSPPFPLTAAAGMIAPKVGKVISVCRVGQTDCRAFREHVEELRQLNANLDVVTNDARQTKRYGYPDAYGKSKGAGKKLVYAEAAGA